MGVFQKVLTDFWLFLSGFLLAFHINCSTVQFCGGFSAVWKLSWSLPVLGSMYFSQMSNRFYPQFQSFLQHIKDFPVFVLFLYFLEVAFEFFTSLLDGRSFNFLWFDKRLIYPWSVSVLLDESRCPSLKVVFQSVASLSSEFVEKKIKCSIVFFR